MFYRFKIDVLFSLFVAFSFNSMAQCGYIEKDKFDNIWVVDQSEIIQFDNHQKKVGSYSNLTLGNPDYIDSFDPFRVIVFYRMSQVIVFLNNKTSEISQPIYLREKGINEVSLVCRSSKGGVWVLNRINWEVAHFDASFNKSSEKFILEATDADSYPLFMKEYLGILYISFKDKGIARYDEFGAYLGTIPVKTDSHFNFINGSIYYLKAAKLFEYKLLTNENISKESSSQCLPVYIQGKFFFFDGSVLAVDKIR